MDSKQLSMDYQEQCKKPIPIGIQKYAYQCETVIFEPVAGKISIHGYKPMKGGLVPYPNEEKDRIEHYDLQIGRFTGNSIEVMLTKTFKDKSQEVFLTNLSFADLCNRLFEGQPANVWMRDAPLNHFV